MKLIVTTVFLDFLFQTLWKNRKDPDPIGNQSEAEDIKDNHFHTSTHFSTSVLSKFFKITISTQHHSSTRFFTFNHFHTTSFNPLLR